MSSLKRATKEFRFRTKRQKYKIENNGQNIKWSVRQRERENASKIGIESSTTAVRDAKVLA
jgi:hypothetical protein